MKKKIVKKPKSAEPEWGACDVCGALSMRWKSGDSSCDGDVAIPTFAKNEGHAIAIATKNLMALGRPDEVFGARAMESE